MGIWICFLFLKRDIYYLFAGDQILSLPSAPFPLTLFLPLSVPAIFFFFCLFIFIFIVHPKDKTQGKNTFIVSHFLNFALVFVCDLVLLGVPQTSAQTSGIESRSFGEVRHSFHATSFLPYFNIICLDNAVQIARKVEKQRSATHEWFINLKVIFLVRKKWEFNFSSCGLTCPDLSPSFCFNSFF